MLCLSLSLLQRRTFAEFDSSPLALSLLLSVLRSTVIFPFSHHFSNIFNSPLSCSLNVFRLSFFPTFIQLLVVQIRVLTRKSWKLGTSSIQTFTADLQSEQVQTHPQKFAPTLALKWYSRDLIGREKLFDISTASQYQGDKCIFSPHISRVAHKEARFT